MISRYSKLQRKEKSTVKCPEESPENKFKRKQTVVKSEKKFHKKCPEKSPGNIS